jgi:hypothetical protein
LADFSLASVPAFWPMAMAGARMKEGSALYAKNLRFVEEAIKIHEHRRPQLATPNRAPGPADQNAARRRHAGRPAHARRCSPRGGHTAMIADCHKGQSLVETLLASGIGHVALTDWKSATPDMKDLEIDSYLEEMLVAIDDLGGRVNLVGMVYSRMSTIAARKPLQ